MGQPYYLKDYHSAYENLATVAINFLNWEPNKHLELAILVPGISRHLGSSQPKICILLAPTVRRF